MNNLPETSAMTTRLSAIKQICVNARDLARAIAFYRDALGMSFLYAFPGMAFFDVDGVRLMLVEPEGRDRRLPRPDRSGRRRDRTR